MTNREAKDIERGVIRSVCEDISKIFRPVKFGEVKLFVDVSEICKRIGGNVNHKWIKIAMKNLRFEQTKDEKYIVYEKTDSDNKG